MDKCTHDVAIVGAGLAGLAAARQAAQAGLRTVLFEARFFGGLVTNVESLDGEVGGSGAEIASNLMEQASDLGVEVAMEQVQTVERDGDDFKVTTVQAVRRVRTVIAASGAELRPLDVPGEGAFAGRGVSHCADCDGPFFRGKDVVVVGGGDAALQAALLLAAGCRKVLLLYRGDRLRARPAYVERLSAQPNIELQRRTRVTAITGGVAVEAVEIERDGEPSRIACHGVFAFIGLQPAGAYLSAGVLRDDDGHVLVDDALATSQAGLFAVGALRAGHAGPLADAMHDGVRAASAALALLRRQDAGARIA